MSKKGSVKGNPLGKEERVKRKAKVLLPQRLKTVNDRHSFVLMEKTEPMQQIEGGSLKVGGKGEPPSAIDWEKETIQTLRQNQGRAGCEGLFSTIRKQEGAGKKKEESGVM